MALTVRSLLMPPHGTLHHTSYLDKDAFSLMWRSNVVPARDLLRLRRRLSSNLFASRPTLVISQWLLSEMSSRLRSCVVERQIATELEFLAGLPSFLFLKEPMDVMKAEVAAALSGALPGVFLEEGRRLPLDCDETWQQELQLVKSDRETFANYHKGGDARVRKHWNDIGVLVKGLNKELAEDPEPAVLTLALPAMRRDRMRLGLPSDESMWPKPQMLPSVWARAAHQVMYAYLSVQSQRVAKPNDFHDWCHYTAAAHADEFVTNDNWARRVALACPPPKPAIITFEEWVESVLK